MRAIRAKMCTQTKKNSRKMRYFSFLQCRCLQYILQCIEILKCVKLIILIGGCPLLNRDLLVANLQFDNILIFNPLLTLSRFGDKKKSYFF